MSSDNKDRLSRDEVIEDLKSEEQPVRGLVMPDSLASLNNVDYNRLGRKATLKMDLVIMPIMVIMYVLNYLDRQNIASAKLANITEDLNLSQVQYQTTVSILFVGYSRSRPLLVFVHRSADSDLVVLMQVPSNMIVGKIKWPGIYICAGMAGWGVISALMAVVHNYEGLLMTRFFLGFIEVSTSS
jgi:hypothetical protein